MAQPTVLSTGKSSVEVPSQLAKHSATFLRVQRSATAFVREIIGLEPWPYQVAILDDVSEFDQVAAHTGHGIGKTALGAWITLWWIFTRQESKVITTAPTWRQVKDLLWSEVHKWHRRMDLQAMGWVFPYHLLDARLEVEQEWFAVGESTDEPEKIEGYHAPSILYIVDEAKAVPDKIFDAMAGGLSGQEAKLVLLSTPGDSSGKLYNVCNERKEKGSWKIHHIDAEDVARTTDGQQVSHTWIEGRKAAWGVGSGIYQLRVNGRFIDLNDDRFCPPQWIEDAIEMDIRPARKAKKVISVDPARQGPDRAVICKREGFKIWPLVKVDRANFTVLADIVEQEARDFDPEKIIIDVGGMGAGFWDICKLRKRLRHKLSAFDGSHSASDDTTYRNRRAEAYWKTRALLSARELDFPADETLEGQFTGIIYKYSPYKGNTVIQLESKDDMRKRGLPSPNEADAIVMACEEGYSDDEAGQGVWF